MFLGNITNLCFTQPSITDLQSSFTSETLVPLLNNIFPGRDLLGDC